MKNLILDDTAIESNYSIHPLKYICIGVFLWLSVSSFCYSINLVIRNLLFSLGTQPIIIFAAAYSIELSALAILLIYAVRKIKQYQINTPYKAKYALGIVVTAFVAAQIVVYFSVSSLEYFFTDNFIETSKNFNDFISKSTVLYIKYILDALQYVIAGVILWKSA